ncbi:MAG: dipeptide epimerase [Bacteroidetes bacterium]|nr:dipeptide epimerase [Bacteroidota bacterium]
MKIKQYSFTLNLKRPFNLAHGSRTTTPIVLVELSSDGKVGYGEASLPPYLGETQESVAKFIDSIPELNFNPEDIFGMIQQIDKIAIGNNAAKAALDIALHDLAGKVMNKGCSELLKLPEMDFPITSFTISIDTPKNIRERIKEADSFHFYKVKLGGSNDMEMIQALTSETKKPFSVDVNQGWINKYKALDFVKMLQDLNCQYIEQPFQKEMIKETLWLADRASLPIIADESVKRLDDISEVDGIYHGINIKLMKSTGITEAMKMITLARQKQMKVVFGSMVESSCGITAAAHLAPLSDWVDLDSSFLISGDPFRGAEIIDGKICHDKNLPGLGISKVK